MAALSSVCEDGIGSDGYTSSFYCWAVWHRLLCSIARSGRACVKRVNSGAVPTVDDNSISWSRLARHQSMDRQQRQTTNVGLRWRLWVSGAAANVSGVVGKPLGRPSGRHEQRGGWNTDCRCCRRKSEWCEERYWRACELDDSRSSQRRKTRKNRIFVILARTFLYSCRKVCKQDLRLNPGDNMGLDLTSVNH